MKRLNEKKDKSLKTIFLAFFKIGLFTFGGGYAMIPLIEEETVKRYHWIKSEDIVDIICIAEATPGVIAVNTASFVGYRVRGFKGAIIATIGVVLPSFIIISIVATFFSAFQELEWVNYAFLGVRAGVIILILGAAINLGKRGDHHFFSIISLVIAFLLASFTEINVIFLIIGGGILGIMVQVIFKINSMGKNGDLR